MARKKAPKRRAKTNPPLTAEEIRLRHAASLESGWRRTARESESREGWSRDPAAANFVAGPLRDERTGEHVRRWMKSERDLRAAMRAVPHRAKMNPLLTAEEIRARHAASLHQGWRRTLDEAHIGWSRDPDDDRYVGSVAEDDRRRVFVRHFTDAELEHRVAAELVRSRGHRGPFYVSAVRGADRRLLAGPYADHETALRDVQTVKDMVLADYGTRADYSTAYGTVAYSGAGPDDVLYRPADVHAFRLREAAALEAEARRMERARARPKRAKANDHPTSLAHDHYEMDGGGEGNGFSLMIERHVPDTGYRYVKLSPRHADAPTRGGRYPTPSEEQRYRRAWAKQRRLAVDVMWDLRAKLARRGEHITLEDLPGAGAIYWRDRGAVTTDRVSDIVDAVTELLGASRAEKVNRMPRRRAA